MLVFFVVSSYFKGKKMDDESKRYDSLLDSNSEPCSIPLEYLRKITNNFSDDQLLGEGGFGKVYKVILNNILPFILSSNNQTRQHLQY